MKRKQFIKLGIATLLTVISLYTPINLATNHTTENIVTAQEYKTKENGTLPFKHKRQLVLGELDDKGRATFAHIQLKVKDEPKKKRVKRLKTTPVGWHNFKFYYNDGTQKAWLMSRGRLICHQFSGLNNERKNLVPMTNWLNTGNYNSTNSSNPESMLFYEKQLKTWLSTHKNYYLDYKVTPIYQNNELIPRKIELKYVGIDKTGKLLPIFIGNKSTQDQFGISTVTLENTSPNATIDYLSGKAQNTVLSAKEQRKLIAKHEEEKRLAEKKVEEEKAAAETQKKLEEEQARLAAEAQRKQKEEQARLAAETQKKQETLVQEQTSQGYKRDYRGRWHRPNGQYASKTEIAAAGLQW
ncbi:TPA: DNA/RNA non-specific endonuclease [Streptococcus agalactiae]